MREFVERLLESDFMPHGSCYFWQPDILWLHTGSDAVIALAYYSIPAALWYFVKKREDLTFGWIFILFGAFIFACGTTHLVSIWTTWNATYRLEGLVKLVTALVSVSTAVLLWPLIPRALALPSPQQLAASNRALASEMADRQRAEAKSRLHLDQLAHVNRLNSLGEMGAMLGHELQQPLGAIVNFSRGCERRLAAGQDPAQLADALKKISQQAERAAEIVRRTRAFSSRGELKMEAIDVNRLVHDVVDLFQAYMQSHRASLDLDLQDPLPRCVLDKIQMEQVLLNLMKNGIEAMDEVPEELRKLSIATRSVDSGHVEILVQDTGGGAAAADLEELFAPFYSTKADGMGMGLTICRSIVEAHGGTFVARRNADSNGLTFALTLPLTPSHEAA